ncbi:hypothetical protein BHM03_00037063 [Ensete ventricosum]|nr:hypothetical protein BHM03_00037063 [Ensete ventricosum]
MYSSGKASVHPDDRIREIRLVTQLPTDGSEWIDDSGEWAEPAGPGAEDMGLPVNEGERYPHFLAGGESILLYLAVVHLCPNLFEIYDRNDKPSSAVA